jgi:hypothetical protein
MPGRTAIALLLLAGPGLAGAAAAQVRECAYPDGTIVFTDKSCDALGAQPAPQGLAARLLPRYRNACARDLQELMMGLSTAIEVGDVNELATYYRWTGLSTRAGYDAMARLEAIAGRPLVDIVPTYPPEPAVPFGAPLYTPPEPSHAPVGLRIEQTLDDGSTPAATSLRLEKELGCWWVHL